MIGPFDFRRRFYCITQYMYFLCTITSYYQSLHNSYADQGCVQKRSCDIKRIRCHLLASMFSFVFKFLSYFKNVPLKTRVATLGTFPLEPPLYASFKIQKYIQGSVLHVKKTNKTNRNCFNVNLIELGDNCIVFEDFTASIGDFMVAN